MRNPCLKAQKLVSRVAARVEAWRPRGAARGGGWKRAAKKALREARGALVARDCRRARREAALASWFLAVGERKSRGMATLEFHSKE